MSIKVNLSDPEDRKEEKKVKVIRMWTHYG